MSNTGNVPAEFKILSTTPELWIKYRLSRTTIFLLFLFFLPFWVLFIGNFWLFISFLSLALYKIVHLGLWQAIEQLFSENRDYTWQILLFPLIFLPLGLVLRSSLWIFGTTNFRASQELLVIIRQTIGMTYERQIPSNTIQYFNQFKKNDEHGISWGLDVVTNQVVDVRVPSWIENWTPEDMKYRLNYNTVELFDSLSIDKSAWLGRVLADFYLVEFRPGKKQQ